MRFPVLTCVLHATYISVEKKIPKKRAVNLQLRIASCYGSVAFMSVCWMAEQVVLPVGLRGVGEEADREIFFCSGLALSSLTGGVPP